MVQCGSWWLLPHTPRLDGFFAPSSCPCDALFVNPLSTLHTPVSRSARPLPAPTARRSRRRAATPGSAWRCVAVERAGMRRAKLAPADVPFARLGQREAGVALPALGDQRVAGSRTHSCSFLCSRPIGRPALRMEDSVGLHGTCGKRRSGSIAQRLHWPACSIVMTTLPRAWPVAR